MASVYWEILSAVQTSAATIVSNCVLRYKLQSVESDSYPLVIVAPGAGGEKVDEQMMGKNLFYVYPVVVAYIVAGNRMLSGGLQNFMNTREALRNQLFQTFLSGAPPFDTDIEPEEAVKFGEYLGSNYVVTGLLLKYKTAEIRSGA